MENTTDASYVAFIQDLTVFEETVIEESRTIESTTVRYSARVGCFIVVSIAIPLPP